MKVTLLVENRLFEYDTDETERIQFLHCGLALIPPELCLFTNLRSLVLCNGTFTDIPPEIGNLVRLEVIFLAGNKLTSIPKEICTLTSLQKLYLNGNKISALPSEIGMLVNLTELHLPNNLLTSLPQGIGNLTKLKNLYIDGNPITTLPLEMGCLMVPCVDMRRCSYVYNETLFKRCLLIRKYFAVALDCPFPVVNSVVRHMPSLPFDRKHGGHSTGLFFLILQKMIFLYYY